MILKCRFGNNSLNTLNKCSLYKNVLTSDCRPYSIDRGDGLFLPSWFEFSERNSLGLCMLFVTIVLLHIHHYLSGHTCLQSPTNNRTFRLWQYFQTLSQTWLDKPLLVKLLELIMRLCPLLETFLVDQVCFAIVAMILIFFRPSDVERCLFQSYSLCLNVPVNVQGFRTVPCLMTHKTNVWQKSLKLHLFLKVAKIVSV